MRWKLAAILLLTLLFLGTFLAGMDPDAFRTSVAGLDWRFLPLFLLCFLAGYLVRCVRLGSLLGRPVPFRDLFTVNAIGFLAINTMPLRLGELVRPTLLLEKNGIPLGASMAAIVTERLMDMLTLLALLLVLGFGVELPADTLMLGEIDLLSAGQRVVGSLAVLMFLGLGAVLALGSPVTRLLRALLSPLPPLRDRVPAFLEAFRGNILALARSPARLLLVLLCTAGLWGSTLVATRVVLGAFASLPEGWTAPFAAFIGSITGMTVAPTPGFVGSFELGVAAGLSPWLPPPDAVRAFAVVYHLVFLACTVGVGLACMAGEGLGLGVLIRPASAPERGEP
jgi:uncharacterized protein (TIRG00374 family)